MKRNHYSQLRNFILASMVLVPLIPFILVLNIGYRYFVISLENTTVDSMTRIVEDHRHMIDTFLAERLADLKVVMNSTSYAEIIQPNRLKHVFANLQRTSNAYVDLGVFSQEGVHEAYHGPFELSGKDYKDTDWFREVMKQGQYVSNVFQGYRQVPHFIIAAAREEDGRRWVLRATIDTYLFNDLVEKVRIGKTGEAYLVSADGRFQTQRRSGGELLESDPDMAIYSTPHSGIRTFIQTDNSDDTYLYATTWMNADRWMLVVRQEKNDAFGALNSAAILIVAVSFVGGGIIVALAFYLTSRIISRLQQADQDKTNLEDQLIRASRLAELGEMAAGFAHEINNPLQIIRSEQTLIRTLFSDLRSRGQLPDCDDVRDLEDSIHQIDTQVTRCGNITQAILKFGRKAEPKPEVVSVNELVSDVLGMVSKRATVHGIAIERNSVGDTPMVYGDPAQLQQVLLNLFNNAIDAVLDRHGTSGGKLAVKTLSSDNGAMEVRVTDNGGGIQPEHLSKVFSPFFTTKPVGKGTGLGLSVCYGIIENMGGTMSVDSRVNIGTTFTVRLPLVKPDDSVG